MSVIPREKTLTELVKELVHGKVDAFIDEHADLIEDFLPSVIALLDGAPSGDGAAIPPPEAHRTPTEPMPPVPSDAPSDTCPKPGPDEAGEPSGDGE